MFYTNSFHILKHPKTQREREKMSIHTNRKMKMCYVNDTNISANEVRVDDSFTSVG
jgi:hypothetical protein